MTEQALVLSGVTKRFGDFTAVDSISLTVRRGVVHGFLGPNGAGKTTTIRMVMNIIRPDTGRIEVLGHESGEEVKRRIGYLPEERGLYKKMKVLDLIVYFGLLKGAERARVTARAEELLEHLELGPWRAKPCRDLSKGMQQKVQFISTIVHEPELVILDEPFSGLDPVNVVVIKDLILDLKRRGATVLFSTHIMDQAEKLCDAVVLLNHGRKVLDGSLGEVMRGAVAEKAIILEYDGPGEAVTALPEVRRANDYGKYMEVYLHPSAAPQAILEKLVSRVTVRRFEVRHPTLNEIFIRAVQGGDAMGDTPTTEVDA